MKRDNCRFTFKLALSLLSAIFILFIACDDEDGEADLLGRESHMWRWHL